MARLRFPLDREDQHTSKITFQVLKLHPPSIVRSNDLSAGAESQVENYLNGTGSLDAVTRRAAESFNNANVEKGKVEYLEDRVQLYMPTSFNVSDNIGYANADLNAAGAVAERGLGNANFSVSGAVAEGLKQSANVISDFTKTISAGTISQTMAARMINNSTAGSGIGAGVAQIARVRANPNIRTMFTGVNVRSFSFSFKLLPINEDESLEIKEIIKVFRENMYPDIVPAAGIDLGYVFPNMFQIKLLAEDHTENNSKFKTVGTPIKHCYLQSMQTNYNPTAPIFNEDGSPVEVDLALNFTEYRALDRRDIKAEGSASYYGMEGFPEVLRPEVDE